MIDQPNLACFNSNTTQTLCCWLCIVNYRVYYCKPMLILIQCIQVRVHVSVNRAANPALFLSLCLSLPYSTISLFPFPSFPYIIIMTTQYEINHKLQIIIIYYYNNSSGKHQSRYELTSPLLVTPVDCFPTHGTFLSLYRI